MTEPALFVAVDGGNSKTDVVLGTATGRLLAHRRGPGSSPHNIGVTAAVDLIGSLISDVRAAAGLPAGRPLERAAIYLAGLDLPVEVDTLTKAVAETGWAAEYDADNDTFAVLRAGTDSPDAVAVVCGAGINCAGRRRDGRTARFPALGQISGDWGGGEHLAALALWHAARGEDGRGPATALVDAVAAHFGRSTVEEVAVGLHLGDLRRERLDELSPVLFRVADAGDPVARRVVARQADEIVRLVGVAAGRLGLLGEPYAVVLGGGVLTAGHPLLMEAVVAGVHAGSPRATIGVLTEPAVTGAALLTLDALGAGPEAGAALRTALADACA
ncbi:MAG TPA: BadF/BadG/BcrA/BcrD ATPase family protein [Micromonosporaceae bacterium]|nr:BadF/BadG/BcrA/BcrD ATPase family protein [Micromonosporaceae bacterium]